MSKNPTRVRLMTHCGKIAAYLAVGKEKEAKEWALKLQQELIKLGLIPS